MTITASTIKELRQATGAGMMDCKKALNENDGNVEVAKDWLRKKGLASAAKKSSRAASEGLVGIASQGTKAAIIELNSETDFVAKNEQFQELTTNIAQAALSTDGTIEAINNASINSKPIAETITDTIAVIGENMTLRRSNLLEVSNGVVATYIHNAQAPNLGKIGVLVALESTGDKDKLNALGKQIAMHIAAAKPESIDREGIDIANLEREKEIFSDQARQSGKPDNIIEKMVEGRIRKYYEQVVLPEQTFVIDGKSKVSEVVEAAAKDIGAEIKITGFSLLVLGEGVEKKEDNFAEEVKAAAGV